MITALTYISLAALTVVLIVAAVGLFVHFVFTPIVARLALNLPMMKAEECQPTPGGERVELEHRDGTRICGTYFKTSSPVRQGVLMFCHELTGDRWAAKLYLLPLLKEGFDVFTFDYRNHGESDPIKDYRPDPWLTTFELEDTLLAIDYLCARPDADPRGVGLLGVSKGGSAALAAAARDRRVAAVVTDGAFALEWMWAHYIRRWMELYTSMSPALSKLPHSVLEFYGRAVHRWANWRTRDQFVEVPYLMRRVRQPVLLVHGERDPFVPVDVCHRLRRHLGTSAKTWIVPGGRHNTAIHAASEKYIKRIRRFYLKSLTERQTDVRESVPMPQQSNEMMQRAG